MTNKKLALFDLDKTIYNDHSFFGLVKFEVDKGVVPHETWMEIRNLLKLYEEDKQSYSKTANQLLSVYATSLQGLSEKDLYSDTLEYFLSNKRNFYGYFEKVIPELNKKYDIYIITTNAQYVAQTICDIFRLKGFISSEFAVEKGKFVGTVEKSLADGKHSVQKLIGEYGRKSSIAVGDSGNDIGMLELVEYPICINPSTELKNYAKEKNWRIVSDKTITGEIGGILSLKWD